MAGINFDQIYEQPGRPLPRRRLIPSAKSAELVFAVPVHLRSSIQGVKEAEHADVAVHSIIIGTKEDSILITNVHLPYKGDKGSAAKVGYPLASSTNPVGHPGRMVQGFDAAETATLTTEERPGGKYA